MKNFRFSTIGILLMALAQSASALVVDAFDRGWYQLNFSTGQYTHNPTNLNYLTGTGAVNVGTSQAPIFQGINTRSFFGFDLAAYAGQTFTSATLRLYNPKVGDPVHNPLGNATATFNGFFQFNDNPANTRQCVRSPAPLSPVACEGYELFDIVSDINALLAGTGGQTAYDDLALGSLYGNFVVTAADNGQFVEVTLNAAGLAAVNSAAGSRFFVGARQFTGDNGLGSQSSFGFSDSDLSDTQLVLTVAPTPVSEPGTLVLASLALLVAGYSRRRPHVSRT